MPVLAPRLLSAVLLLSILAQAAPALAQCDTTVSTCAAARDACASDLSTTKNVCLDDGDHGDCELYDLARTEFCVVKCTNAEQCSMSPRIGNSSFIRIQDMHLVGGFTNSCSTNIQIAQSTVGPETAGFGIDGSACAEGTAQNILIDGVDFTNVGQGLGEGRLSIRAGNAIQVRNSSFVGVAETLGASGPSDGIQVFGSQENTDITIGPGNVFKDIRQDLCDANGGAHCDAIQFYSPGTCGSIRVEGNFFQDSSTLILNESPCNVTIRNNVFRGVGDLQAHCWSGGSFEHNTLYDTTFRINGVTSPVEVRSNIFHDASYDPDGPAGSNGSCPATPCSGCVESYDLYSSGCSGKSCVTGTPTYVGGAPPPETWAGWQLTPESVGHADAHDGADRGAIFSDVVVPPEPDAGPPESDAGSTSPDAGPDAGGDPVDAGTRSVEGGGDGCGCRTPGGADSLAGALLVAAFLVLCRRSPWR